MPTDRADAAIAALDDATAAELRGLAQALELTGGTFRVFAPALASLSASRGAGCPPDVVDRLSMRTALRRVGYLLDGDPAAMARLEDATERFWVAVREAVAAA